MPSSFSSRRERFVSSSPFLIPFLIVSHSPRKITERSTEPISTFFYLPSTMYIRWPVLKFLEIPRRLDYSSSIFFFRSRSLDGVSLYMHAYMITYDELTGRLCFRGKRNLIVEEARLVGSRDELDDRQPRPTFPILARLNRDLVDTFVANATRRVS